jgi:DNA (cytosine-5)-methyltransferase 1
MNKPDKLKLLDVFAGIGGFHIGVQNASKKLGIDFECVGAIEYDTWAKETYATNNKTNEYFEEYNGDITKIPIQNLPKHNIITGGFPCQSFSLAGNKKGLQDNRGGLFYYLAKILEYHKPEICIFENVKNIQSTNNGEDYKNICKCITSLGYNLSTFVLGCHTHGNIPQCRERLFFVGLKDNSKINDIKPINLTKTTNSIIDRTIKVEDKYYYTTSSKYHTMLTKDIVDDAIYQLRRIYIRKNKNNLCPTLTANMGTGGHNVPLIKDDFGIRKLTPRECASFQGFDKTFILHKTNGRAYKQIGNSVCPLLIQRIVSEGIFYDIKT